MLRTVHLHGRLKKLFGASFRFDVSTAAEAMRALNCAFPGRFVQALKQGSYHVIRGRRNGGMHLDLDLISQFKLGQSDLHIVPATKGSANGKGGGATKAILGVALVGAAIFFSGGTLAAPLGMLGGTVTVGGVGLGMSYGAIAALGVGMTLAGVSQMLAKPADATETKKDDSFTLSGPTNVTEQGVAVPIIIGNVIVGSQAISAGADIEDMSAYQNNIPATLFGIPFSFPAPEGST